MKLETILDALIDSHYQLIHHWNEHGHNKRYRQRDAFRARILRMDAEKDELIKALNIISDRQFEMIEAFILDLKRRDSND